MTNAQDLIEQAIEVGRTSPPVRPGESTVLPGVMHLLENMLDDERETPGRSGRWCQALARTALDDARVVESPFGEAIGQVLGYFERQPPSTDTAE